MKSQRTDPPQWAIRFLHWYCNPDLLEDLEGDLYELFDRKCQTSSPNAARRHFAWWVLRSFRWSAIKKHTLLKNNTLMITTLNLKVAARVLWRDRLNTLLNVAGIAIGIVCFVLMGLYVWQESTYDHFHSKKDRIYRAWLLEDYGEGKTFFNAVTPIRFEALFENDFPEFERVVQYDQRQFPVSRSQEHSISERIALVSPDFFEVFDFPVITGSDKSPLDGKYDLVISKTYAEKYFGDLNPVGQTLQLQLDDQLVPFTITAMIADIPKNSSIQFNLAISNALYEDMMNPQALQAWMMVGPETYVLVKENSAIASAEAKSQDVVMRYLGEEVNRGEYNIGFQPLTDIHLNPEVPAGIAPVSNPIYVYILGVIGLLVLLVACINYTTLAIGQSFKRAREVGMRKILGANNKGLMAQYLSESILVALVAMLIGTVLAIWLVPVFNRLTGADLVYTFQWQQVLVFLIIGVMVGIISGIYPAVVLTNTRVMRIMQASGGSPESHWVRKVMLTCQFAITILLISSSLIMRKQIDYLQSKDLGYDYEAVVAVPMHPNTQGRMMEQMESAQNNAQLLMDKLAEHPQIDDLTTASHSFGSSGWALLGFSDKQGAFRQFRLLTVDENYLDAFGIPVVTGRGFEAKSGLDKRQSILLNEAAVAYFGLEDPIGKKLPGEQFGEHQIIGVVKDFHFQSLHEKVEPLVITQNPMPLFEGISDINVFDSMLPKLMFKYTGSQLVQAQQLLEQAWEGLFPNVSLDYHFVDDAIQRQYANEARLNKLVTVATVISMLIAVMGLLGLTVLVVNSREKEIGIRKVIGATRYEIFGLLAKTFRWQLVLGIMISVPVTLWLMRQWLQDFAYRVDIGVDMFISSALISVFVAFLVISYHAWRASRLNPVKSLRVE